MSETRASIVKKGLLLLGGAVGVGAGAAGTNAALGDSKADGGRLALHGRGWLLQSSRRPGERIEPGDRGAVTGELVDADGRLLGHFHGTRMAFTSARASSPAADGSMELHTFELAEGTLLGMGSSVPGASVFAIVGGTGKYAGARGTYVAEQRLRELGGDGTADFVIDLSA